MIVRALDNLGQWTFGKGKNNYKTGNSAVAQMIATRLRSFVGDCFYATAEGVDWFNLLGAKDQVSLQLAINACILGTDGVTSLTQSFVLLDRKTRRLSVTYVVTTVYSGATLQATLQDTVTLLTTEDGLVLTTEDGTPIGV